MEGLEHVEEREITILIRLLEDTVEVANRLMFVHHQAKPNGGHTLSWAKVGMAGRRYSIRFRLSANSTGLNQ
jgi:hypothetical protein